MEDAAFGWRRFVESGTPIALGLYYDNADRDELIEQIEQACAGEKPRRLQDAEALLSDEQDGVVLLDPADVAATLALLETNRDRLSLREGRKTVLLLSTPIGVQALTDAPALESWLRENTFGSYAIEERPDEAREAFAARAGGRTPEQFLEAWRHGELPDDGPNNALMAEALFLSERGKS